MDKLQFEAVDPLVDDIAEMIDKLLESADAKPLRESLEKLVGLLGEPFSANLTVTVDVFESKRGRCLPLLNLGMSAYPNKPSFSTSGDSSPQRYIVSGQIVIVPHDRCPNCWQVWDFKWTNSRCLHCDSALGENTKILLDDDVCPMCAEGKVSMADPTCDKCGYVVDPRTVEWG